jgi:hypothetical protein
MFQNIKLIRDHSIKRHNLDEHYDITDETYYNRPFFLNGRNKQIPLWKTRPHYKGGFKNLDAGHLAPCMRQLKPQRTDLLGEDNIIYHLKANRDREYREEVYKIFKLDHQDPAVEEKMVKKQNDIYKILNNSKRDDFKQLINYIINNTKYGMVLNRNKESAFSLLFNYETFWMIHRVIKEFYNNNGIKVGDTISRIRAYYTSK